MSGWVKLHRGLLEWEWYDDINTKSVFIHILLSANHKPKKWRGIEIDRGQFLTSTATLSKSLGLTVKQVRRCIDNLKSTNEIEVERASNGAMITVCNYSSYQDSEDNQGQTKGRPRADLGQQHKKEKNEKNVKKTNADASLVFSFWNGIDSLITHRSLTKPVEASLRSLLKDKYTVDEITKAISVYGKAVASDKSWVNHRWTLGEFLKKSNACRKYIESNGDYDWLKNESDNSPTQQGSSFKRNYAPTQEVESNDIDSNILNEIIEGVTND